MVPQLMPAGLDVTTAPPAPVPLSETERVAKLAWRCVFASASETSVSPGNEVSKSAAEKSSDAGKFAGGGAGTVIGFDPDGILPSVSNSCDRLTTRVSVKLVA